MCNNFKLIILSSVVAFLIAGCASESARMAHSINKNNKNDYKLSDTKACSKALTKSNTQDTIFNTRLIATPLIGILGIVAAPALIAINGTLDIQDRLAASDISQTCGGKGIDPLQIAQDVTINSSIGLVLQGSNISVYPGGEEVSVSAAAEAGR